MAKKPYQLTPLCLEEDFSGSIINWALASFFQVL